MLPPAPVELPSSPVSERISATPAPQQAPAPRVRARAALEAFLEGRLRLLSITRLGSGLALRVQREERLTATITPARERLVLSLLVQGASQKQIAYELGVSPPAVSACVRNLLRKLCIEQALHLIVLGRAVQGMSEPSLLAMSRQPSSSFTPDEFVVQFAPDPEACARLTLAELDVTLDALVGHGNSAIAAHRRTSLRTVVNQLAAVFRKLGISGRQELVTRLTLPGSCAPRSESIRRLDAAAARDGPEAVPTGYDGPSRWMKPQHVEPLANAICIAGY